MSISSTKIYSLYRKYNEIKITIKARRINEKKKHIEDEKCTGQILQRRGKEGV